MENILENVGGNFSRVQLGGDLGVDGRDRVGLGGCGEPDMAQQHLQKRSKDTSSGDGVSPMTLKAQPPRKRRPGVGRQLLFPEPTDTEPTSSLENMPVATEYHPAPLMEHSSSRMNVSLSYSYRVV